MTGPELRSGDRQGSPFSNMTQFEYWAPHWCWLCTKDDDNTETYCPILTISLTGVTPREWTDVDPNVHGNYECSEFDERPEAWQNKPDAASSGT